MKLNIEHTSKEIVPPSEIRLLVFNFFIENNCNNHICTLKSLNIVIKTIFNLVKRPFKRVRAIWVLSVLSNKLAECNLNTRWWCACLYFGNSPLFLTQAIHLSWRCQAARCLLFIDFPYSKEKTYAHMHTSISFCN